MGTGQKYLVVGRASMDLTPVPFGTSIETAQTLQTSLGGSAANIAVGLSKLGCKASLLTALSDDPVGRFCRTQLTRYAVDTSKIQTLAGECRTSLALTEARVENHQTLLYRNNASDLALSLEHADSIDLAGFGTVVITGTALAVEPSRTAVFMLLRQAQASGLRNVLDIDYRAYSWAGRSEASAVLWKAISFCDVVVGNDEEWPLISSSNESLRETVQRVAIAKPRGICVLKLGERGSVTHSDGDVIETPIFPVHALKPVGSGDAFLSALLASLDAGNDLLLALQHGSASAAITVSKPGCAPAMPDWDDLEAFMKAHNGTE
ncbi:MAG: PfkB family carbohydrate kinase [Pseudomonadota bacterium]